MEFTAEILDRLDKQVQEAKKHTKHQARKHLQEAGIITAKGKLAAPYRSKSTSLLAKPRKHG